MLSVSKRHKIYYEESGNKVGIPVVFLHGGPGAGTQPKQRQMFDPSIYRAILFDQRGCGKSTPRNEIEENTTQHLIADIEKLRVELGIEKWVVVGSSWGTTLGLAYAQEYPSRVLAMVLRSVFLGTEEERDWIFHDQGAARFFPKEYEDFANFMPKSEHGDLLDAYLYRVKSETKTKAVSAAKAILDWEYTISSMEAERLLAEAEEGESEVHDDFAYTHSLLEFHYGKNYFFLSDQQLISNMAQISKIPSVIIHGQYDLVCPLKCAWDLHKAWPKSQLIVDAKANHSGGDMKGYVVGALSYFAQRIKRC